MTQLHEVQPIREEAMVAKFLDMEYPKVAAVLATHGYDQTAVTDPDLDDEAANAARSTALWSIRGWPNLMLFMTFPSGVEWHSAKVRGADLDSLRLLAEQSWLAMSPFGLPSGAAQHARDHFEMLDQKVRDLADSIKSVPEMPPLILVGTSLDSQLVCLDGNHRLAAYAFKGVAPDDEIDVIVGVSARMSEWMFFGPRT